VPTVDEVADSLRRALRLRGLRRSYLEGCESMQRVHISPRLGDRPVSEVTTAHVEALAGAMLDRKLAPKNVRNVLTFLHSVFEHAIDRRLITENPVRRATRPGRRRKRDANPDLQFLTVEELEAVIRPRRGRAAQAQAHAPRSARPHPRRPAGERARDRLRRRCTARDGPEGHRVLRREPRMGRRGGGK
jgi:hypothetical protein